MRAFVTGGCGFIGRHLCEELIERGYDVTSFDLCGEGSNKDVRWIAGSILDSDSLRRALWDARPKIVFHLAAVAKMGARSIDEFKANIDGTRNVLDAISHISGVEHVVITSTQHVRRPGLPPALSDEDYAPLEFYGESKVLTEKITKDARLGCRWTIVRPTAVWGPHHQLLADGLWRQMWLRRYVHPANDPVVRSYGFVRNVCWQMVQLAKLGESSHGKTLYVADENLPQIDWVNAIAIPLVGRRVRTVPLGLIKALSHVGDIVRYIGGSFPMYSSRLANLTAQNPVPIERTFMLVGRGPYSLASGVEETVNWLRGYYR